MLATKNYEGVPLIIISSFFYDGTTLIDKIPDVPKPTTGNVGILLDFSERRISKTPLSDIEIYVFATRLGRLQILQEQNLIMTGKYIWI